jgi:hypothetical protein
MTSEEALVALDRIMGTTRFSDLQEIVLCQVLQGKKYAEIAESAGYDPDYIKLVGCRLWKQISEVLGERVTKSNLHAVLARQVRSQMRGAGQFYFSTVGVPERPLSRAS